jgi:hypothetical protein
MHVFSSSLLNTQVAHACVLQIALETMQLCVLEQKVQN